MGVNQQLIIMIGCNIGYDTYYKAGGFDKFESLDIDEEKLENVNRIAVISDGMSGEYCMVGIPIYVSGKYDGFSDLSNNKNYNGLQMMELNQPKKEQVNEIECFIERNFKCKEVKIKNLIFIHHT